jgi:uncharacterized ubiquitin-like protein YukD
MINVSIILPEGVGAKDIRLPVFATVQEVADLLAEVYKFTIGRRPFLVDEFTGHTLSMFDRLQDFNVQSGHRLILRG